MFENPGGPRPLPPVADAHGCKHKHFFPVIFLSFVGNTEASGRLVEPPSRSSLWRFKYTDPVLAPFRKIIRPNYDDMNLNCGGKKVRQK